MISLDLGHIDPAHLRALDRPFFADPVRAVVESTMDAATYAFRVDYDGRLVLACWATPEPYPGPRRGWLQMVFGLGADHHNPMRWARDPLRFHRAVMRARPFDVLRAWVAASDDRAQRFAHRMGFRYDAGPASGILPDGRDASLWIWRAG